MWEEGKVELPGLSCRLPVGLRQNQLSSYTLQVRLEDINKRIKDPQTSEEERLRLTERRAYLIEDAIRNNPEFQTPIDFIKHIRDNRTSRSTQAASANSGSGVMPASGTSFRYQEKIWIPQREYPDVNFMGLLIGPRGHTLKKIENDSGCKITIRGKGSLKEGKNDPAALAAANEEMHAIVMADTVERLSKGVKRINNIIESACSAPQEANELKKAQLRELALLNGTLKEDLINAAGSSMQHNEVCSKCGQPGHRHFECLQGQQRYY